jgi:hypothetical protein
MAPNTPQGLTPTVAGLAIEGDMTEWWIQPQLGSHECQPLGLLAWCLIPAHFNGGGA